MKSLGRGIYHDNERKRYGEPCSLSIDDAANLVDDLHFLASSALKSLYWMMFEDLQSWIATTQTIDYIASAPIPFDHAAIGYLDAKKEEVQVEA